MNSAKGIFVLLLCLIIWTEYMEGVTLVLRSSIRKGSRKAKTTRSAPTVPNAITQLIRNGVKPATNDMQHILNIIAPKGMYSYY